MNINKRLKNSAANKNKYIPSDYHERLMKTLESLPDMPSGNTENSESTAVITQSGRGINIRYMSAVAAACIVAAGVFIIYPQISSTAKNNENDDSKKPLYTTVSDFTETDSTTTSETTGVSATVSELTVTNIDYAVHSEYTNITEQDIKVTNVTDSNEKVSANVNTVVSAVENEQLTQQKPAESAIYSAPTERTTQAPAVITTQAPVVPAVTEPVVTAKPDTPVPPADTIENNNPRPDNPPVVTERPVTEHKEPEKTIHDHREPEHTMPEHTMPEQAMPEHTIPEHTMPAWEEWWDEQEEWWYSNNNKDKDKFYDERTIPEFFDD